MIVRKDGPTNESSSKFVSSSCPFLENHADGWRTWVSGEGVSVGYTAHGPSGEHGSGWSREGAIASAKKQ